MPAARAETKLTDEVRALYEGAVVPVREVARLAGVSLRTLYYHVHARGWRRRRSDVPRDRAKAERQRRRYEALQAMRPPRPAGLKARDPAGEVPAQAVCAQAGALSETAMADASAEMAERAARERAEKAAREAEARAKRDARSRQRSLDHLSDALGELGRFWRECAGRPPSLAEALAARLYGVVMEEVARLVARR